MTERLRRFHTFKSGEELLEYRDSLPEEQRTKAEEAWDEYFDLRKKGLEIRVEAEKRFWEVLNPYLALNTFAFIELFKRNAGLGLAAHAAGDILVIKAAIDSARKSTRPRLEALRQARGAFKKEGIEIRGVRDLLSLIRIYRDFRSAENEENLSR